MTEMPQKRAPAEVQLQLYDCAVCIVAARFNSDIVDALVAGACAALRGCGVSESAIEIIHVPGAFEIPLAAQRAARSGRFDALVALGAVVRGGTPHFEFVSGESIRGINQVALDCDIPVGNGILTVDTMEQAVDRAGGAEGNKGAEAALAAAELLTVLRELGD